MNSIRKPRMLIFSYSPIANDGRVMRQVNEFANEYDVVTCGGSEQPHPDVEHVRVEYLIPRRWARLIAVCLHLKWFWAAYWLLPIYRQTRKKLKGYDFDVVLANDLTAAGVVRSLFPAERIHFDLHEYWLGLLDNNESWVKLRVPFHRYLLNKYVVGARSFSTVSRVIADRYEAEFGFASEVVTNASTLRDLPTREATAPLRMVHSGAAKPARRIELMMEAAAKNSIGATLDLYLTGEGSKYYDSLVKLADQLGDKVRFNPPVPHAQLVDTLNKFDVGLTILPPTTTNIRLCLPNKFFDYVQARLAIITGPTEAMSELTKRYELGIVTADFSVEHIMKAIDSLDSETVMSYKRNADTNAEKLSAGPQIAKWKTLIEQIIDNKCCVGQDIGE